MSYFIVSSIKIDEKIGKVFLSGSDSNIYPRHRERFESTYLSDMLKESGREAVDAYLLQQYEGGMMQGGNNEYTQTGAIFNEFSLESLNKLRTLKAEARGKKFILACGHAFVARVTRSGAKLIFDRSGAKTMNCVEALVAASKFRDGEMQVEEIS